MEEEEMVEEIEEEEDSSEDLQGEDPDEVEEGLKAEIKSPLC